MCPQMQYTFIYQALLEYHLYGDTELDVSSLEKHLQTLQGTSARFNKMGLEEEFRVSVRRTGGRDVGAALLGVPGRRREPAAAAGKGRGPAHIGIPEVRKLPAGGGGCRALCYRAEGVLGGVRLSASPCVLS